MSKVVFVISMSEDGFIAGPNPTPETPAGEGGDQLNAWMFTPEGQEYLERQGKTLGSVVCGRVTYDTSLPWWGNNGPSGPLRRPVVVVTSRHDLDYEVYHFQHDVSSAYAAAQFLAEDKIVCIMGGAATARAFFEAGLVDEVVINYVPVRLGYGLQLLEHIRGHLGHIVDSEPGRQVRHVTYSVRK
jgi:dihydrofolate reductase